MANTIKKDKALAHWLECNATRYPDSNYKAVSIRFNELLAQEAKHRARENHLRKKIQWLRGKLQGDMGIPFN